MRRETSFLEIKKSINVAINKERNKEINISMRMEQVYKMMLGTSGKQYELLTVKDDGTMTLDFNGTDRSVTQQVTAITDGEWKGWLKTDKGSLWPGVESGKWQAVSADAIATEVPSVAMSSQPTISATEPTPAPKRKRRSRKAATPCPAEVPSVAVAQQPQETESEDNHHQWLRPVGYVAAAGVALFLVWQTGLIIPLGLIGLASGGLLK